MNLVICLSALYLRITLTVVLTRLQPFPYPILLRQFKPFVRQLAIDYFERRPGLNLCAAFFRREDSAF
jgi:hypothetical protein